MISGQRTDVLCGGSGGAAAAAAAAAAGATSVPPCSPSVLSTDGAATAVPCRCCRDDVEDKEELDRLENQFRKSIGTKYGSVLEAFVEMDANRGGTVDVAEFVQVRATGLCCCNTAGTIPEMPATHAMPHLPGSSPAHNPGHYFVAIGDDRAAADEHQPGEGRQTCPPLRQGR